MDLGEEGMRGPEAGVVILLPTQRVRSRRGPGRARTPRLDIDRALADLEVDAGRTIRRQGRAPGLAVVEPQPRPLADRAHRQGKVERPTRIESSAHWSVQVARRLSEPRR